MRFAQLTTGLLTVIIKVLDGGEGVERAGNEERSSSRSGLEDLEWGVDWADAGGELGATIIWRKECIWSK